MTPSLRPSRDPPRWQPRTRENHGSDEQNRARPTSQSLGSADGVSWIDAVPVPLAFVLSLIVSLTVVVNTVILVSTHFHAMVAVWILIIIAVGLAGTGRALFDINTGYRKATAGILGLLIIGLFVPAVALGLQQLWPPDPEADETHRLEPTPKLVDLVFPPKVPPPDFGGGTEPNDASTGGLSEPNALVLIATDGGTTPYEATGHPSAEDGPVNPEDPVPFEDLPIRPKAGVPPPRILVPKASWDPGFSPLGVATPLPPQCPDGMAFIPGDNSTGLDDFCLDHQEVTVARYVRCEQSGGCTKAGRRGYCNAGAHDRSSHPINCVKWSQARHFCDWNEKRLPDEDEWQWAAQGGHRGIPYPWGDAHPNCDRVVMQGCGKPGTHEVGSLSTGASLQDMAGNVWEWTGQNERPAQVIRGGGWQDGADQVGVHPREKKRPDETAIDIGFRCARDVK